MNCGCCGGRIATWRDAARLFRAACKAVGIPPEALRQPQRKRWIVERRWLVAYFLHRRHVKLTDIGALLGRDHSTIDHALKEVQRRLRTSEGEAWVDSLARIEARANV